MRFCCYLQYFSKVWPLRKRSFWVAFLVSFLTPKLPKWGPKWCLENCSENRSISGAILGSILGSIFGPFGDPFEKNRNVVPNCPPRGAQGSIWDPFWSYFRSIWEPFLISFRCLRGIDIRLLSLSNLGKVSQWFRLQV